MKKLYHYPLCPLSRQIRVCLKELSIEFSTIKEDYWRRDSSFLTINPAGTLPVLVEPFGLAVVETYPIIEYLHDKYPTFNLMDEDSEVRTEIRRLLLWFNEKFYREVSKIVIDEKIIRLQSNNGSPRTEFLRAAKNNLTHHLTYLTKLIQQRSYVASDSLSVADIAAACHLSVLDYFGEINWDSWQYIRDWYAVIKSRPSYRYILQDQIPGFPPAKGYIDLDF